MVENTMLEPLTVINGFAENVILMLWKNGRNEWLRKGQGVVERDGRGERISSKFARSKFFRSKLKREKDK